MKDFEMTIDEYSPLRDVVFNTLRRAILKGLFKNCYERKKSI